MALHVLFSFIGALSYAIICGIRGRTVFWSALGGALSWLIYEILTKTWSENTISVFVASAIVAVYAELLASRLKKPAIVFFYCGVIPLVPGSGMYYTMSAAIKGENLNFLNLSLETLLSAGAIAAGIAFVTSISAVIKRLNR